MTASRKPASLVLSFLAALLLGLPARADELPVATAAAATAAAPPMPAGAASKTDAFKESLTRAPKPEDLKPTGPIDITADHLESTVGNTAVYTGNVKLNSNTLRLDGDRLELTQYPNKLYTAKLTGNPGHMLHAGAGPDNPPVDAKAKTLNYDMRSGTIDLLGDAYLKRCNDTINAETMRYNVATRSYDAARGNEGQVHIVLQPDAPEAASKGTPCGPAAPAAASTATP